MSLIIFLFHNPQSVITEKTNPSVTNTFADPSYFLENCIFEGYCSICTLLGMVLLHDCNNQVSTVVADVLVPTWNQVICNNHDD